MTKKHFLRTLAGKLQDLRENDIIEQVRIYPPFADDPDFRAIEELIFEAQTRAEEASADED